VGRRPSQSAARAGAACTLRTRPRTDEPGLLLGDRSPVVRFRRRDPRCRRGPGQSRFRPLLPGHPHMRRRTGGPWDRSGAKTATTAVVGPTKGRREGPPDPPTTTPTGPRDRIPDQQPATVAVATAPPRSPACATPLDKKVARGQAGAATGAACAFPERRAKTHGRCPWGRPPQGGFPIPGLGAAGRHRAAAHLAAGAKQAGRGLRGAPPARGARSLLRIRGRARKLHASGQDFERGPPTALEKKCKRLFSRAPAPPASPHGHG